MPAIPLNRNSCSTYPFDSGAHAIHGCDVAVVGSSATVGAVCTCAKDLLAAIAAPLLETSIPIARVTNTSRCTRVSPLLVGYASWIRSAWIERRCRHLAVRAQTRWHER